MEAGWKMWMRLEVLEHPTNELYQTSASKISG